MKEICELDEDTAWSNCCARGQVIRSVSGARAADDPCCCLARQVARVLTEPSGEMLDALFGAQGDRDHWFARLLCEAATPSQIRAWTVG